MMERTDYKQILILFGTTLAVYISFRYLLPLVTPFLLAYLIAILLYPIANYLKKKWRISNGVAGSVLVVLLIGLVGAGVFFVGKVLFGQVRNVVANFPTYEVIVLEEAQTICGRFDKLLGVPRGNTFEFVSRNIEDGMLKLEENVFPFFSSEIFSMKTIGNVGKIFNVFWFVFIILMGAFFIIKDMEDLKIIYEESSFYQIGKRALGNVGEIGGVYLKAQFIIMLCSAVICSSGLALLKVSNSLFWGIGISIFDAFPVLGSGLILIPWTMLCLLKGNWYRGAVVFAIYVLCQLIREMTEAKLLGDKIGIKPVFTLASMYIGTELFGVAGFILGPVGFLLIKNVVKSQY